MANEDAKPMKSHVEVVTKPIDAEAEAPKLPTIEASMYCMTIEEICAMIAGTLSMTANRNCIMRLTGCAPRMVSVRVFLADLTVSRLFDMFV
jgi:hypothetical protein